MRTYRVDTSWKQACVLTISFQWITPATAPGEPISPFSGTLQTVGVVGESPSHVNLPASTEGVDSQDEVIGGGGTERGVLERHRAYVDANEMSDRVAEQRALLMQRPDTSSNQILRRVSTRLSVVEELLGEARIRQLLTDIAVLLLVVYQIRVAATARCKCPDSVSDNKEHKMVPSGHDSSRKNIVERIRGPGCATAGMGDHQQRVSTLPVASSPAHFVALDVAASEVKSADSESSANLQGEVDLTPTSEEGDGALTIPEPTNAIQQLMISMDGLSTVRPVRLADGAWHSGFARHVGPVRENQEDYVVTFGVGDIRVCLLADGAGGHPFGERASYLGVIGAATSLAQALADWPDDRKVPLEDLARQAAFDASFSIATHAVANGISQDSAMRSTLIVLLADEDCFAWANLGDGGGWSVHGASGSYEAFLVPAQGEQQNHLLSSLGPHILGEVASGTRSWGRAYYVVVASDGVADVIDHRTFFEACFSFCLQHDGRFSEVAEAVLDQLVASPGVTDNVSLGFIGRGFGTV